MAHVGVDVLNNYAKYSKRIEISFLEKENKNLLAIEFYSFYK